MLRRANLLNIALIHNHDRVRHGKCLFLIVCYINKSNAKFVFEADQFILHILTQFQIQGTERFIQKKYFRFIYNRTGNRNTLLLAAA